MRRSDPPDWALPAWDDLPGAPARPARAPGGRPAAGSVPGAFGIRILGVSEVTRAIREAVRADDRLRDVWVEGEVGRVTISSAGHAYFALKDERNQLQCVWFRDARLRSAFEPQAGLRIVANGRIDLFEPQGALQLYVESIQPAGLGDLTLRFEALKARLAAEGLFDAARKRPLPVRPGTIAVVTSPTGAVWRDICHVLARRWPLSRVVLVACQVQGEAAPGSIVAAFRRLERHIDELVAAGRQDQAPAVTILARGGGSLEDLWAFNDERVVRAVIGHAVPVVCGVGHEVDVTLADFAADVRAPTPSAAAEIVVPDRVAVHAALRAAGDRLAGATTRGLRSARRELDAERRALDGLQPAARLAASRERAGLLLDRATRTVAARLALARAEERAAAARLLPLLPDRLAAAGIRLERSGRRLPELVDRRIGRSRAALAASSAALSVLGPQATLDRGYAIVRREADGAIVRGPADAPPGTSLHLRLARGEVAADARGPVDAG